MGRPICRVLACIVCILLVPPAWGAAGKAGDEAAIRALIENGRFGEALARLPPPGRAAGPESSFLYGLAAIGASRRAGLSDAEQAALLDGAIAALRAVLIDDPGLVRVRLELARAFFLKGEDSLARSHFERVLAGEPPPNVAANVGRFLAEMRARRRWSFHLGAALAPDSNIASASEARTIPNLRPCRSSATPHRAPVTSGVGVALWGGAEYQHPLGRGLRLRAGADAALRDYKGSGFDNLSVSVHLGPRWLLDARTEASLLASARQSWAKRPARGERPAPESRVRRATRAGAPREPACDGVRASCPGTTGTTSRRRDLDGPVLDASLNLGWTAAPTAAGWIFTAGTGRERPFLLRYRNHSLRLGAAVSVALPRGFTLGGGGEIRWASLSRRSGGLPPATDRRAGTALISLQRSRCTTADSRSSASARNSSWSRRSGPPTRSFPTTGASAASCASCASSRPHRLPRRLRRVEGKMQFIYIDISELDGIPASGWMIRNDPRDAAGPARPGAAPGGSLTGIARRARQTEATMRNRHKEVYLTMPCSLLLAACSRSAVLEGRENAIGSGRLAGAPAAARVDRSPVDTPVDTPVDPTHIRDLRGVEPGDQGIIHRPADLQRELRKSVPGAAGYNSISVRRNRCVRSGDRPVGRHPDRADRGLPP